MLVEKRDEKNIEQMIDKIALPRALRRKIGTKNFNIN
jgi:hypothetical protein